MFGIFKSANEFRRLGKAMDELHVRLDYLFDLAFEAKKPNDYKGKILAKKFILEKAIVDRMEKYNWDTDSKIFVNFVPDENRPSMIKAFVYLSSKMNILVDLVGVSDLCEDITNKKGIYNELNKLLQIIDS